MVAIFEADILILDVNRKLPTECPAFDYGCKEQIGVARNIRHIDNSNRSVIINGIEHIGFFQHDGRAEFTIRQEYRNCHFLLTDDDRIIADCTTADKGVCMWSDGGIA